MGGNNYRSTRPVLALDRAEGKCWGQERAPQRGTLNSGVVVSKWKSAGGMPWRCIDQGRRARQAGAAAAAGGGSGREAGRGAGGKVQEESWWDGKGGRGPRRQRAAAVGGKQGMATATKTNNCNFPAQIRYQNKFDTDPIRTA
ncbi:hypothetical protein B0H14DRAFT_2609510 [Mycena olivaceomarginata]|nr:hypothetical protein B0H14DRAFT_2609510 [Mycena olivaceomarginata]